jgi:hypothetical protein
MDLRGVLAVDFAPDLLVLAFALDLAFVWVKDG